METSARPLWLTDCNCSLCRRLGALWLHCAPAKVTFLCGEEDTIAYVQGDRTLATHHCPICGCTTHWRPTGKGNRMAI